MPRRLLRQCRQSYPLPPVPMTMQDGRSPLHRAFVKKNFANRDPEEVSELGRVGGLIAQRSGNAHRLTREERSRGGKIGGKR